MLDQTLFVEVSDVTFAFDCCKRYRILCELLHRLHWDNLPVMCYS